MAKVQVIVCNCGKVFAGCVEPWCYTEKNWTKELAKYVKEGKTVEMRDAGSFKMESCTCFKSEPKEDNNPKLF
jgi:hypothetical protein